MKTWWLPKAGLAEAEYEDAFWPPGGRYENVEAFHAAIADGATEASFSREWARRLVRFYCAARTLQYDWLDIVPRAQGSWLRRIGGRALPWYAEEKLRMGSFAAFLGLTLSSAGVWESSAIGDSCLFQMRSGAMVAGWPVEDSARFAERPLLLSTRAGPGQVRDQMLYTMGGWEPGDEFLLMTDALAAWFLRECEQSGSPACLALGDSFPAWIAGLRAEARIRNDDVTLCHLRVT